jgi:hypothetical protein
LALEKEVGRIADSFGENNRKREQLKAQKRVLAERKLKRKQEAHWKSMQTGARAATVPKFSVWKSEYLDQAPQVGPLTTSQKLAQKRATGPQL